MEIICSNEHNELYNLLALRPQDATPEIIASRLAKINRFNGATLYPYSVAQHSVFVAALVRPELRIAALYHDASEAYLVDVPHPVKYVCDDYRRIETLVEDRLALLGIPDARLYPEIKEADHAAYRVEREHLRGRPNAYPGFARYLREIDWRAAAVQWLDCLAGH